jgi:hypothetical protein
MNIAERPAVLRKRQRAAFEPIRADLLDDLAARADQVAAVRKALTENPVPAPRHGGAHWAQALRAGVGASLQLRITTAPLPRLIWRGL